MDIERWWPTLSVGAREWLTANNGDAVPEWVLDQIVAAGGDSGTGAGWLGDNDMEGVFLSDRATDWIEAVANGES